MIFLLFFPEFGHACTSDYLAGIQPTILPLLALPDETQLAMDLLISHNS